MLLYDSIRNSPEALLEALFARSLARISVYASVSMHIHIYILTIYILYIYIYIYVYIYVHIYI